MGKYEDNESITAVIGTHRDVEIRVTGNGTFKAQPSPRHEVRSARTYDAIVDSIDKALNAAAARKLQPAPCVFTSRKDRVTSTVSTGQFIGISPSGDMKIIPDDNSLLGERAYLTRRRVYPLGAQARVEEAVKEVVRLAVLARAVGEELKVGALDAVEMYPDAEQRIAIADQVIASLNAQFFIEISDTGHALAEEGVK